MKTYGGGTKSNANLTTNDPNLGAVLACGHVARGLIARVDVEALCFDCRQRQAVVTQWPGAIPDCGKIEPGANGASDGEDG